MEYIAGGLVGLTIGAVLAWLIATKRGQSDLVTKVREAERSIAAAESKAASAEAIQQKFASSTKRCAEKRRAIFRI